MFDSTALVADADGNVAPAPEAIEQPSGEDPRVFTEAAKLEVVPAARLQWLIKAVDYEFSPHAPATPIDEQAGAAQLAGFVDRAGTLIDQADRDVARERGAWADPSTRDQRVNAVQEKAAKAAEQLYRDCRREAAAFITQRIAPPPAPDDVGYNDIGQSILTHWPPNKSHEWFTDRYYAAQTSPTAARAWQLLRMLCLRVAQKPPAHIHGTPWQAAFGDLAQLPFPDPVANSRAAREFANGIVDQVRRKLTHWAIAGAGGHA